MGEAPLQAVGLLVTLAILVGATPMRLLRDARGRWRAWPRGARAGFRPRRGPPGQGLYALIGGSALLGLLFLTLALARAPA